MEAACSVFNLKTHLTVVIADPHRMQRDITEIQVQPFVLKFIVIYSNA
jgi:hypothetical protein